MLYAATGLAGLGEAPRRLPRPPEIVQMLTLALRPAWYTAQSWSPPRTPPTKNCSRWPGRNPGPQSLIQTRPPDLLPALYATLSSYLPGRRASGAGVHTYT